MPIPRMTIQRWMLAVAVVGLWIAGWSYVLTQPEAERDLDWFVRVLFLTFLTVVAISSLLVVATSRGARLRPSTPDNCDHSGPPPCE